MVLIQMVVIILITKMFHMQNTLYHIIYGITWSGEKYSGESGVIQKTKSAI